MKQFQISDKNYEAMDKILDDERYDGINKVYWMYEQLKRNGDNLPIPLEYAILEMKDDNSDKIIFDERNSYFTEN